MEKRKQRLIFIIAIVLCATIFAVAALYFLFNKTDTGEDPFLTSPDSTPTDTNTLVVLVNNDDGILVKEAILKFLAVDISDDANYRILPGTFSKGDERLDIQVPVSLTLFLKEGNALSYKIELSDNESFTDATIGYLEAYTGTYEFEHLYADTTYYWRVTAYTNDGSETATGSFTTADTPRILTIDGLSNVRDIGGWMTDSGKKIKQGLLIRGTEADGAVESEYTLTDKGLSDMLDVLGIKTETDLRPKTDATRDIFGTSVQHKYYDMAQYEAIFTDAGKEKIRALFADLAEPGNYPMYMHCTYGLDRTGTVCYILEAMLGVSKGDCRRDYGLSNNTRVKALWPIEEGLEKYDGETLKEQAESYLLSCGVTESQIESIRNIFLED